MSRVLKSVGNLLRKGLIEEGHFMQRGLSRLEVLNGGITRVEGLSETLSSRQKLRREGVYIRNLKF